MPVGIKHTAWTVTYSLVQLFLTVISAHADPSQAGCPAALTAEIPRRDPGLPPGSAFAAAVAAEAGAPREAAIGATLLEGNIPGFLRRLKAISLSARAADGTLHTAIVCVMPDYLAIGTDDDYLRMPMDLHTATAVAARFGFVLPTRRMVDAIYAQSEVRLPPQPLPAGPRMRSTGYYVRHDTRIAEQLAALREPAGVLLAGHKKDVVLSNRLLSRPGRVAIYGWHRREHQPIQPLSTVHGAGYADYSHGVRLVADIMQLDGQVASLYHVLTDPVLAPLLSDEGPVRALDALIPQAASRLARLEGRLLALNHGHPN